MARPKSEDKRIAILDAATAVFAKRGVWSTPTSAVSRKAGVAEGTLFTYFPTKEALMNGLYRALKLDLAAAMLPGLPKKRDARRQYRHIWECYVHWGVKHPDKFKVMAQLRLSDQLGDESRAAGMEPFLEIERATKEYIRDGVIRDLPLPFLQQMMGAVAETTMCFMSRSRKPAARREYCESGFEMLWKGIARK